MSAVERPVTIAPVTRARTDAVIAPRYLARFRCIAGACEDTCCRGWNVALDPSTLARWQDQLGAARVAATVDVERRKLRMLDDGSCAMLDGERLCAVHRELGPAGLPDTCALFPRVVQEAGDRRETTASLACPEVARLSLLVADAHELVELEPAPELARTPHTQVAPGDRQRPWIVHAPRVRDLVDRALAEPTWPVATRLFALARLGELSRLWFRASATDDDAGRLVATAATLFAAPSMALVDDELRADAPAAFAGAAIVTGLLATRLATPTVPALHALLTAALEGTDAADGAVACGARRLAPAQLWAAHDARLLDLPDDVLARLDEIDRAWARHYWRQRWHLFATDLFAHGLLHLVSRAAGRTLLLVHPHLRTDVDRAAVETLYLFTRHLEHVGLHDQLADRLCRGGHETRAVARALLLF